MVMNYRMVNRITNQSGFTIIEVLIALAIFAIGCMAVGALQTGALMTVNSSQGKTLAMEALNAQTERLKQTPLYKYDIWRDGYFQMSDEFSDVCTCPSPLINDQMPRSQWCTNNPTRDPNVEEYTVSWCVDTPRTKQITNRWTTIPANLEVSKNVTVTVAKTKVLNTIVSSIEFVKNWVTDN